MVLWPEHPVALFFLSFSIGVFVVGFSSPSSIIRLACLPLLLFNVWLVLRPSTQVSYTHPMYANLLGGSIFSLLLKYLDTVVLRKSTYEAGGPTTTPEGNPLLLPHKEKEGDHPSSVTGIWRRLHFGIAHLLDTRLSGTPWEVKNVPPFNKNDPSYVPSKSIFLRNNILRVLISVTLLDLGRPSADTTKNAILFAESKVPFFARLGSVTTEDVAMRFVTTLASVIITYLLFQAVHASSAVVTVTLGLSKPERWRPLFGDVSDAWSLRRAWG